MADAVLAGQDQGVSEELLTDGADQLPLYVLDRDPNKTATPPLCRHPERGNQCLRVSTKGLSAVYLFKAKNKLLRLEQKMPIAPTE